MYVNLGARSHPSGLQRDFPSIFKEWYDSLGGDASGLTWEQANPKVFIAS